MKLEELMKLIAATLNASKGSFYTSTNLKDNPDVCHACCTWFLSVIDKKGFKYAVEKLDVTPKKTFMLAQEQVIKGVKQPAEVLKIVRSSAKDITDEEIQAIESMISHYQQPKKYETDKVKVVKAIVDAVRGSGGADKYIIYINPTKGKGGHVICLARNVGGIVIYDPNIGLMTCAMKEQDTWGGVLKMILDWYDKEMKLDGVGFLPKE